MCPTFGGCVLPAGLADVPEADALLGVGGGEEAGLHRVEHDAVEGGRVAGQTEGLCGGTQPSHWLCDGGGRATWAGLHSTIRLPPIRLKEKACFHDNCVISVAMLELRGPLPSGEFQIKTLITECILG